MSIPILSTKLFAPQTGTDLVSRPRLVERLDDALTARLILISAPAGFGKTTLIGEWMDTTRRAVAWLSLDEGDNALARFWAYVIAALQTAHLEVGQTALAALDVENQGWTCKAVEPLLITLINDLVRIPMSQPTTLALDDYHLVRNEEIHQSILFFIDHLPPPVNVLIATRVDPPLPLPRWRVRRQLLELRQADLRFTLQEVTLFFNRVMRLQIGAEDIAALDGRTEGWIAGLQMAALSLQGRDDVSDFVRAFAGSNRYVLDYLLEEVLDREPEPVRAFLLRTSILDRLCGPLCAAVCGGEPGNGEFATGQSMLEYLEANNLFVVSLDQDRQWYRYHHLFADLLQSRLRQVPGESIAALYTRASRWYEEAGDIASAFDYALKAEDVGRAADLIEAEAMRHGMVPLRWIDALPDETVLAHPILATTQIILGLVRAQVAQPALTSRLDEVASRVENASPSEMPGEYRRLARGYLAWAHGFLALVQNNFGQAATLVQQTLQMLPPEVTMMRSMGLLLLGQAYVGLEDGERGNRAFRQAHELALECGALSRAMIALAHLTINMIRQGKLRAASKILQEAIETYAPGGRYVVPEVSGLALNLGAMWMEQNHLDRAELLIQQGRKWAELTAQSAIKRGTWALLMHIRRMRGDWAGARAACDKMAAAMPLQTVFNRAAAIELDAYYAAVDPKIVPELARQVAEQGLELMLDQSAHEQLPSYGWLYARYRALVRATVALRQWGDSTVDLAPVHHFLCRQIEVKQARGWYGNAIELLVMQAMAYKAEGEADHALDALARALKWAEPEGYVRVFVDQGVPMAALLRQAAAQGIATTYVGRLLAAFEPQEQARPPDQGLIEPLTDREIEVLRLIVAGLSNKEIADQLVLAVGTVKKHINNIYGKLGVRRRAQAIGKARALDLV